MNRTRLSPLSCRRGLPLGAGSTLIELVVALVIFSLLISMAFQISMNSTRAAAEQMAIANLEVKAERTLKMLTEALTPSANLGVDADGTGVSYYVPLDKDLSGTVLRYNNGDPLVSGSLEYGMISGSGTGAGQLRFDYIADRSALEADEDVDINKDGDQSDEFDIGYVRSLWRLDTDPVNTWQFDRVAGVTNIMQKRATPYGQSMFPIGTPNMSRIFTLTPGGRVLEINLVLFSIGEDRIPHVVHSRGQVFLRNQ